MCSRPAFIRSPRIVHNDLSRSTSCHVAPRTLPLRAAVRIRSSSALADTLSRSRSRTMKAGT